MSDKTKGILVIVLAALVSGAVSPVTKIGLVIIPPFSFSFVRFIIASFCLLPLFLKSKPKFNKEFIYLILLSILPTLNVALFVVGLKSTTASVSQFLYAATPLLAGIFSYFIFNEKLSLKKLFFILIGLIGVSLVIFLPLLQKNKLFAGSLEGNALIMLGVILWSLYFVYSKRLQKKYSPMTITSIFIFVATILFFFLSAWEFQRNSLWIEQIKSTSIYAMLYVSLFATVGSYLLNQYAIKFAGPVVASFLFYLLPIFGYLFSFLLLGEKLTIGLIVGTALVFLSVTLMTYTK